MNDGFFLENYNFPSVQLITLLDKTAGIEKLIDAHHRQ